MNTQRPYNICSTARTEIASGETDFGVQDERGRKVGYSWNITRVVYTIKPEGEKYGECRDFDAPMSVLRIDVHVTRNGRRYGASQRSVDVLTLDEAEAVIAKKTDACRKVNVKRFTRA